MCIYTEVHRSTCFSSGAFSFPKAGKALKTGRRRFPRPRREVFGKLHGYSSHSCYGALQIQMPVWMLGGIHKLVFSCLEPQRNVSETTLRTSIQGLVVFVWCHLGSIEGSWVVLVSGTCKFLISLVNIAVTPLVIMGPSALFCLDALRKAPPAQDNTQPRSLEMSTGSGYVPKHILCKASRCASEVTTAISCLSLCKPRRGSLWKLN